VASIGIFGDGARSGATAMRTAKRDSPCAQCVHECVVAVHLRWPYSVRQADRVCSILHRRYEVPERKIAGGARGNGELPMNDAQRYRMNAAECLSAAERCGPAYRDLTVCMAKTWLALARHQDAMDGLLAVWSEAGSATAPIRRQYPREPSRRRIAGLPAREAISA